VTLVSQFRSFPFRPFVTRCSDKYVDTVCRFNPRALAVDSSSMRPAHLGHYSWRVVSFHVCTCGWNLFFKKPTRDVVLYLQRLQTERRRTLKLVEPRTDLFEVRSWSWIRTPLRRRARVVVECHSRARGSSLALRSFCRQCQAELLYTAATATVSVRRHRPCVCMWVTWAACVARHERPSGFWF